MTRRRRGRKVSTNRSRRCTEQAKSFLQKTIPPIIHSGDATAKRLASMLPTCPLREREREKCNHVVHKEVPPKNKVPSKRRKPPEIPSVLCRSISCRLCVISEEKWGDLASTTRRALGLLSKTRLVEDDGNIYFMSSWALRSWKSGTSLNHSLSLSHWKALKSTPYGFGSRQ